DKVPGDRCLGERLDLVHALLHIVFPELVDTGLDHCLHFGRTAGLADREQCDAIRRTPSLCRGFLYTLPHAPKVVCYAEHEVRHLINQSDLTALSRYKNSCRERAPAISAPLCHRPFGYVPGQARAHYTAFSVPVPWQPTGISGHLLIRQTVFTD